MTTQQTGSTAREKAQQKARENEDAIVEMRELESGDPPTDLDDWPNGPAKYLTYGNEEDEVYGVGVTAKLGPANLARFSDGSIAIDGKKVDNPDTTRATHSPAAPPTPAPGADTQSRSPPEATLRRRRRVAGSTPTDHRRAKEKEPPKSGDGS